MASIISRHVIGSLAAGRTLAAASRGLVPLVFFFPAVFVAFLVRGLAGFLPRALAGLALVAFIVLVLSLGILERAIDSRCPAGHDSYLGGPTTSSAAAADFPGFQARFRTLLQRLLTICTPRIVDNHGGR